MMERHVVDGGYVTNYNDPVVGIKPINQKSIETAMSGKKFLMFKTHIGIFLSLDSSHLSLD